ncbi:hypothetical protein [Ferrimonas marina]|uniref:Uncharacterized protein n=1 Tax=Ferrimonas marina TaxID=299255 RepID=A0A1M5UFA1_9GAMM|nr:hypothetical protein [Ferrimonas marina]SHH61343.1 hypothetical protein SAMN02745129_2528 [Ferrimonas marina]
MRYSREEYIEKANLIYQHLGGKPFAIRYGCLGNITGGALTEANGAINGGLQFDLGTGLVGKDGATRFRVEVSPRDEYVLKGYAANEAEQCYEQVLEIDGLYVDVLAEVFSSVVCDEKGRQADLHSETGGLER